MSVKHFAAVCALLCGVAYAQTFPVSSTFEVCPQAINAASYTPDSLYALIAAQGKDGWLYGADDLKLYSYSSAFVPPMKRFGDYLKSRGIELIVVAIPPRVLLTQNHIDINKPLPSSFDLNKLTLDYKSWTDGLNAAGIFTPDLTLLNRNNKTGNEIFFTQDHHWTPYAAKLTADLVSKYLSSKPVLNQISKVVFDLKETKRSNSGSYLNSVNTLCKLKLPAQDYISLSNTPQKVDLLSDSEPDIVLLGTSNSTRFKGTEESFAAALRYDLQRDVVNAAVEGGGTFAALETYLSSGEFRSHPAKVIVWQMDAVYDFENKVAQYIPVIKGECQKPTSQMVGDHGISVTLEPTKTSDYAVVKLQDTSVKSVSIKITLSNGKS